MLLQACYMLNYAVSSLILPYFFQVFSDILNIELLSSLLPNLGYELAPNPDMASCGARCASCLESIPSMKLGLVELNVDNSIDKSIHALSTEYNKLSTEYNPYVCLSNDNPTTNGNTGTYDNPTTNGNTGTNGHPTTNGNTGTYDNPTTNGNTGTYDNPTTNGNTGTYDNPTTNGNHVNNGTSSSASTNGNTVTNGNTGNTGINGNTGNSFSGPNDDVANCEHDDVDRGRFTDCDDFRDSPVNCTYCDGTALNGTAGQSAILCGNCGACICDNCNDP